jgi:hypothetical protein
MCIWRNEPIEILDVPEDKPIRAYKYLAKSYSSNDDLYYSPLQMTKWVFGEKVSSRTKDPLRNSVGSRIGIYAFASKQAAVRTVSSRSGMNYVVVQVLLWGKVAVHAAEPFIESRTLSRTGKTIIRRARNTRSGRFKGFRAQHAKVVKVY